MLLRRLAEASSKDSNEKKVLFDMPLIKKRLPLLTKIISNRAELEIEVLFAVQVIVHKKDVYTGEEAHLYLCKTFNWGRLQGFWLWLCMLSKGLSIFVLGSGLLRLLLADDEGIVFLMWRIMFWRSTSYAMWAWNIIPLGLTSTQELFEQWDTNWSETDFTTTK